jgi:hypothetical protein
LTSGKKLGYNGDLLRLGLGKSFVSTNRKQITRFNLNAQRFLPSERFLLIWRTRMAMSEVSA